MNEILTDIALISLLHDIPHIIQQAQIPAPPEKNIIFYDRWTNRPDFYDFIFKYHTHKDLDNHDIDEKRIYAELIASSENLSLAKKIDCKGELSPLKSVYSVIKNKPALTSHIEAFFHASEMSDAILLDSQRSKKDLYFAPSYIISSFIEDINRLFSLSEFPKVNTLFYLIKKYFWSMALSHHGDDFCYSVFDHAKITCAIACSLYQYLRVNHKNVLISRNINFIREKMSDPVEPRMQLLKINLITDQPKPDSNAAKLIKRNILISVSHKILDAFQLFEPNIIYAGNEYSLVLLPNLNMDKIIRQIEDLNLILYENYRGLYQVSFNSQILKENDITAHFSSCRNLAGMLWNEILPSTDLNPPFAQGFHINEYDRFFGPYKTDCDKKSCSFCGILFENSSDCPVCGKIFSQKDVSESVLFIEKKNCGNELFRFIPCNELSKIDTDGTAYFLSGQGNFIKDSIFRQKIDSGFMPGKVLTETKFNHRIRIKISARNPENHMNIYPSFSFIHSYLSMIEIFLPFYFEKLANTYNDIEILSSISSETVFTFDLSNLYLLIKNIFHDVENFLRDCPTVSAYVFFETDDNLKNDIVKFDLRNKNNLFFIFDKSINWVQALQFLETGDRIINYPDIKTDSALLEFLTRISNGNFSTPVAHKYRDEILNFFDPRLLSKWILYLIKKECFR